MSVFTAMCQIGINMPRIFLWIARIHDIDKLQCIDDCIEFIMGSPCDCLLSCVIVVIIPYFLPVFVTMFVLHLVTC